MKKLAILNGPNLDRLGKREPAVYGHATLADLERDLRYFNQRVQSAQVVPPAKSTDKVQIGNWVTFANEQDEQQRIQLTSAGNGDAAGKELRVVLSW